MTLVDGVVSSIHPIVILFYWKLYQFRFIVNAYCVKILSTRRHNGRANVFAFMEETFSFLLLPWKPRLALSTGISTPIITIEYFEINSTQVGSGVSALPQGCLPPELSK